MHNYATLDDSLRKVDIGGEVYEVEVHCLCDSQGNERYLTVLKREHTKIDSEILQRFLKENLGYHELYTCSFYKSFELDYPVSAYLNKRTRKNQPKQIVDLFKKADRGASRHSKAIVSELKGKEDLSNLDGLELLLLDV